jgi:hypothetical protein
MLIGVQAVINIAVSTGLMPTKGLPLPFISYGGSALLINMSAAGILMNIAKNQDVTPVNSPGPLYIKGANRGAMLRAGRVHSWSHRLR